MAGRRPVQACGCELVGCELPALQRRAFPTYYVDRPDRQASANLARYDGVQIRLPANPRQAGSLGLSDGPQPHLSGFCEEVATRILIGTMPCRPATWIAYYKKAQRCHPLTARDFDRGL